MRQPGPFRYLTWERLQRITGRTRSELEALASDSLMFYSPGKITDRKGKVRDVDLPSFGLKVLHNALVRDFFTPLRPHPCAACVKGRGAVWAAKRHAGAPFLLHLDVANHFPSITQDRVYCRFVEAGAKSDVAWIMAKLLCLPDRLPQGAATSNAVAEILMYPLDARIAGLARREGLRYTRYVDDLTVSGGARLVDLEEDFRELVRAEGWELNKKGGLVGPDEHHRLLGLTINEAPGVGRRYARALRDDLRKVSAGIWTPNAAEIRSLKGRVQWVVSMNPKRADTFRTLLAQALAAVD